MSKKKQEPERPIDWMKAIDPATLDISDYVDFNLLFRGQIITLNRAESFADLCKTVRYNHDSFVPWMSDEGWRRWYAAFVHNAVRLSFKESNAPLIAMTAMTLLVECGVALRKIHQGDHSHIKTADNLAERCFEVLKSMGLESLIPSDEKPKEGG